MNLILSCCVMQFPHRMISTSGSQAFIMGGNKCDGDKPVKKTEEKYGND